MITQNSLPILGDRVQIQQVILNLVVNGIEAMRDTPSENRVISIRTSRDEKFAELSVSDRGPGIPEDKLKEVFEPFYTSKAEGMGMGLSIARTIVEAHNGQIWAKSGSRAARSVSDAGFLSFIGIGAVYSQSEKKDDEDDPAKRENGESREFDNESSFWIKRHATSWARSSGQY